MIDEVKAKRPRRPRKIVIDESVPFRDERQRFLDHMRNGGWHPHTIRLYELRLAVFASRVDIMTTGGVTQAQIESAADDLENTPSLYRRSQTASASERMWFVRVARRWLRFIGRFREREPAPYTNVIRDFETFLDQDRGLSPASVGLMSNRVSQFLVWLDRVQIKLPDVSITDVEAFLASERPRTWSRVTVSICVACLRSFFRYTGKAGLCAKNIAGAIDAPRLYSQSNLPRGPSWPQVRRLISSIGQKSATEIRDRAMIILLALYGIRRGELSALRLDSFDWEKEQLIVKRGKLYCEQLYPLVREAGDAVLLYLQKGRPRTTHRELFLSSSAPFGPITPNGVSSIVQRRMKALGEQLPHLGPHSLRHACATHLLAAGCSLKEIGDHLGHRDPRSTLVYAKVDLKALREVARLDLGGLI
jgi:site-specific recombinase XerD